VGRREVASSLKRALERSRLVTLTGPGGVGKTRLALHVADQVQRGFRDGVHFVELAKVQDPSLVVQAIAIAMDLRDQSARSSQAALIGYLSGKHVLIVLDNCEHVLPACSDVVSELLLSVANVHLLITSREPLNIAGESVFPVPPLTLPTGTSWSGPDRSGSQCEAVALFEARAAAALPGFAITRANEEAVVALCSRLDGLPLAIELAAVRTRVLSPAQVLARLEHRFELLTEGNRGAPQRQQTLQAAIAWSYELCSETERTLWAHCSVFAGEFDIDAAEFVCVGDGVPEGEVFSGIAALVDKSILSKSQGEPLARYRMLETIRQFGAERLVGTGTDNQVRVRHRDYYLDLATRCDSESGSAQQLDWAARLPADRADLFAALDYCVTHPSEARVGQRMASSLWFYWIACGMVRDGRFWLDRVLAADLAPSPERARALLIDGWATVLHGENKRGVELLSECRRLAALVEDDTSAAQAAQMLGLARTFADDPAGGAPLLEAAVQSHLSRGDWSAPALIAWPQLGLAAVMVRDTDRAVALADQCRELCAVHGERWVLSWMTWVLALSSWVAGDIQSAVAQAREALRQKGQLNDQLGIPFCIELLAWAAQVQGDPHRAATLFGAADTLWERIGRRLFGYADLLRWASEIRDATRAAMDAREFEARLSTGARLAMEEMLASALAEPGRGADSERREETGPAKATALTRREQEVAGLVAAGLSNREIAERLVLSVRTAEAHVEHILTKLGFTSRAQIATWVAETGGDRRGDDGRQFSLSQ
jgi:predicted ATPase/DNA-binding CsgD family transcriptional regulator